MTFVIGSGHHLKETDGASVVAFASHAFAYIDVFAKPGFMPGNCTQKDSRRFAARGAGEEWWFVLVHDDGGDVFCDRLVTRLRVGERLLDVAALLDTRMQQVDHDGKDDCF